MSSCRRHSIEIVGDMHEDGTLTEFSEEWYDGLDLTTVRITDGGAATQDGDA